MTMTEAERAALVEDLGIVCYESQCDAAQARVLARYDILTARVAELEAELASLRRTGCYPEPRVDGAMTSPLVCGVNEVTADAALSPEAPMFPGTDAAKQAMIQQGYVPETCTLDVLVAGPLIWQEVNAGRDPCAGCNMDRAVCHGRPKKPPCRT